MASAPSPRRVVTTHLELTERAALLPARAPQTPYTLVQVARPSPELSHFLYRAVGGDWFWLTRLAWDRARWLAWLARPEVETWVAYLDGAPLGYFELEAQPEASVEIVYFGLLPDFLGRGYGGALLTDAVRRAWARGARRVWLHTCDLDHPHALAHYQARGFRVFQVVEGVEMLPARSPRLWEESDER